MCNSTDTLNGDGKQNFTEDNKAESARSRLYSIANNINEAKYISAFLSDILVKNTDLSEEGLLGLGSILIDQEKRLKDTADCLKNYMDSTGLFIPLESAVQNDA